MAETAKNVHSLLTTQKGVLLTWDKPASGAIVHYVIERSVDGGDWETIKGDLSPTTTDYTDPRIPTMDEQFAYRVAAKNGFGTSDWSNTAYFNGAGDLTAPSHLHVVAVTPNPLMAETLTAGASKTVDVAAGFTPDPADISVSYAAESDATAVATASASGSMVSINAVGVGMANITVTATALDDTATQTIAVTVIDVPGMPTAVGAVASADGTMITVSWMPPATDGGSAVTGYTVMYRVSGSSDAYMSIDAEAADRSATIENLTAGTDYDVAVVAVNAVGSSAMATAMGMTHNVPGMPMNVMATAGYASASDWWETLDCAGMVAAVPTDAVGNTGMANMDNPYCAHYPGSAAVMGGAGELATEQQGVVDATFAMRYPNMGVTSVITITWDAPSDGGSAITGYTVQSKYGDMDFMDATVKHLAMDYTTVVHTGLMANTTYTYQVNAMNAVGNGAWSMEAAGMTGNNAPMAVGSIAAQTVTAGESVTVHFDENFSDADMDDLTYMASSSDESVATVDLHGDHIDITGVAAGMATIRVTAADGNGGTAMQSFMVTVVSGNTDPMAVGSIDAVTLTAGMSSDPMDVSGNFSDADDDELTYGATSSDTAIATASVDGSMVTITAVAHGSATITVTASDGMGGMDATQTIMVTVEAVRAVPDIVVVNPAGSGLVNLEWVPVPGAQGYYIVAAEATVGGEVLSTAINRPDASIGSIGGLTPGEDYLIFIGAFFTAEDYVLEYVRTITAE